MFRTLLPYAVAVLMVAPVAWSAELPQSIHNTLDEEYPGWKLAPVSPQILQEFKKHKITQSPSMTVADFDHDGKLDYAVQIALMTPGEEEQFVIIFLARDNAYEETIVQSMGLDRTAYLWSYKNILMVLGGPVGDSSYAYQDGRFQEVAVPDDPDHPDPSIPRVPETP